MPAPRTVKMSIVLDSSGQVVGASKPTHYQPAKEGHEPVVTVRLEAGPGQSLVEVDVPPDLADLDGSELLSRLADHSSVRTMIADLPPTAGEAPHAGEASLGPSQGLPTATVTAGSL
jgi:hypothetical protein